MYLLLTRLIGKLNSTIHTAINEDIYGGTVFARHYSSTYLALAELSYQFLTTIGQKSLLFTNLLSIGHPVDAQVLRDTQSILK